MTTIVIKDRKIVSDTMVTLYMPPMSTDDLRKATLKFYEENNMDKEEALRNVEIFLNSKYANREDTTFTLPEGEGKVIVNTNPDLCWREGHPLTHIAVAGDATVMPFIDYYMRHGGKDAMSEIIEMIEKNVTLKGVAASCELCFIDKDEATLITFLPFGKRLTVTLDLNSGEGLIMGSGAVAVADKKFVERMVDEGTLEELYRVPEIMPTSILMSLANEKDPQTNDVLVEYQL